MKTILLLIFFLLTSAKSFGQAPQGLTIEIELKNDYLVQYAPYVGELKYVPAKKEIAQKRYDVLIRLRNNSTDTVRIWLMKCSWYDNFIINNNYISFYSPGCDGNYPRIVTINPADSFLLNSTLKRDLAWDNPCGNCVPYGPVGLPYGSKVKTTRVGLIFVDGNAKLSLDDYENITLDKSRWTIIWSNPIELNK